MVALSSSKNSHPYATIFHSTLRDSQPIETLKSAMFCLLIAYCSVFLGISIEVQRTRKRNRIHTVTVRIFLNRFGSISTRLHPIPTFVSLLIADTFIRIGIIAKVYPSRILSEKDVNILLVPHV